jgi:hypothetical protein
MADASIEIVGLDELMAAVGRLAAMTVVRDAMETAVERVRTQIAIYPPPPGGYRMVWKSERQRRFFFAALRDGRIQVPYRRTGTLGRRWTTKVSGSGGDIVGEVGNVTVYGPFVQSQAEQAQIHQGRWRTDEQVATMMAPSIQALFEAKLEAAMP